MTKAETPLWRLIERENFTSRERLADFLELSQNLREQIDFSPRFPIGIPERLSEAFLQILQNSSKQVIFILHCNHPRELDAEVLSALKNVQKLGIPLLNQSVLLKGVNDNEETLLALSEALVERGIMPYYLHLLDLVEGSAYFWVSDERAKALIQYLQEHNSGYAVPKLVREMPGHPSKVAVI